MALTEKNYLDQLGLQTYDALIKAWVDGTGNKEHSNVVFRTVLYDSDNIYFYHKVNAQSTDTADVTVPLTGSDVTKALAQVSAIVASLGGTMESTSPYTVTFPALTTTAKSTLVAAINELDAAIDVLNGADTVSGSVAKSIKDAIEALDVTEFPLAEVNNNVVTIHGISEADGEIAVGATAANDIVLEEVAYTGAAADVSIADAGNLLDATNVEAALQEVAQAIEDATDGAKVTCEESAGSGDVLKVYSFYQGVLGTDDAAAKTAKKIVDINIPKDYLVKSATIKTVTVENEPYAGAKVGDKYIDFTINTKDGAGTGTEQHIYIAINDLVAVIQGSVGAEVTITIGANNTIQATINKIDASKIEYKAETTAGAGDGETVKQALTRIDGDASTPGSINKAKADVIGVSGDGSDANTVYGAKAYADSVVADLDTDTDVSIASYDTTTEKITLKSGIAETDGVIQQGSGDDIVIAPIAAATINNLFTTPTP